MPRPKNTVPTYRLHKQSGQALVTVTENGVRRDICLGKYGTPESKKEYERILATIRVGGTLAVMKTGTSPSLTVIEVLTRFLTHAHQHYRNADGKPTSEVHNLGLAFQPLRALYAHTPVTEFGPLALKTARQWMIDKGWCRKAVNARVGRIKRAFKWAASEELISIATFQSLTTVAGLQAGRSNATERAEVKPVDPAHVTATLPFLSRHVRAIVELMQHTGTRPGEASKFRFGEVDRTGEVWTYTPARHKSAHRGKTRVVHIGPRGQAVLLNFLRGDNPPPEGWNGVNLNVDRNGRLAMADAYQEAGRDRDAALLRDVGRHVVLIAGCVVDPLAPVFSPHESREEGYRVKRRKRKTKVQPSQKSRKKVKAKRQPGAEYNTRAVSYAVWKAAKRAGVPSWHPNQLRHTHATTVRQKYGLEAAGASLGHAKMSATQVYAERDSTLAAKVASEMG